MALPIFAITIFVSAFLLFLVQPLVGKLILPKLGGTPQVWNTCMVFFQSALLLGYAYTHSVSTKLKLRQQMMVHAGLLGLPILMMLVFPIYATVHAWSPPTDGNPIPNTLWLLAIIVGVPFFVVSTSAPLLQKWFAYSGHATAKDPYFLYSASNVGSLLSLLVYPVLIEPNTFLQDQAYIWFAGYVALAGLILYCAYTIYTTAPSDEQILALESATAAPAPEIKPETPAAPAPAPVPSPATSVKAGPAPGSPRGGIQRKKGAKVPGKVGETESVAAPSIEMPEISSGATAEMTWWRRTRWILLAAVPSSLMLGVTSYISTDLSPFPLVWVIPLALYLFSFVVVYTKYKSPTFVFDWAGHRIGLFGGAYTLHQMTLYVLQPLGLIILCFIVLRSGFDPFMITSMLMLGFFANALACHGELAQDRPATKHLTEYFLMMSVGGMVGGMFNGIFAPIVFQRGVFEFYVAIVIACFVRPQYIASGWFDDLILQAFPGLQNWVRNQGDEMAKSLGRPAPRNTYLFSLVIDIVFGLFILSIAYWLRMRFNPGTNYGQSQTIGVMKFLQLPQTEKWLTITGSALVFGIPLVFCFFFAGRPLRLGLAVFGLLYGSLFLADRDDRVLEARRTYFGVLRVMKGDESPRDQEESKSMRSQPLIEGGKEYAVPYPFTYLMHGTTYHGRNYFKNVNDEYAKYRVDISRLATTYYHRYGPVGVVMEQDNWFPGKQNTFDGDARLPVSMIGMLAGPFGFSSLVEPALATWSEPPIATIGLGTGTMASYGRPFQFVTYYEIDEVIRHFSLPEDGGDARFTYLQNAIRRGVNVEVIMGDARLSLQEEREKNNIKNSFLYRTDFTKKDRPYELIPQEKDKRAPDRDNFYKYIVVDAFSSDAIPVHLVTKQAIGIYLSKLTSNGVLLVHTSNRHMDLVRPVARIAMEFKDVSCLVGKDQAEKERFMGHFSSEYVMIFRGDGFQKHVDRIKEGREKLGDKMPEEGQQILNSMVLWYNPYQEHKEWKGGRVVNNPINQKDSLWTDDYSYILGVLR